MTRIRNKTSAAELLRRPETTWQALGQLADSQPEFSKEVVEQVVTDIRYAGYLRREAARAARTRKMTAVALPTEMSFRIPGISNEVAERLEGARPRTLGAAARLPGITPAAIDLLAAHLSRR
jgi:tRNA uridine 5-carboxymethylaminomethyl modification enzyme